MGKVLTKFQQAAGKDEDESGILLYHFNAGTTYKESTAQLRIELIFHSILHFNLSTRRFDSLFGILELKYMGRLNRTLKCNFSEEIFTQPEILSEESFT